MIAALVDVKVDPSKFEELKTLFGELRDTVLANEAGVLAYHLIKLRDGSCNFSFIEIYQDMDAVRIHGETDYFLEARPKLTACLTEEPVAAIYDVVV